MKLNFGCGRDKYEGKNLEDFIGVDNDIKNSCPDVIWDLNKYPYPFYDNTADEIYSNQCIEHLKEPLKAINEMLRIAKPNAKIKIIFPHKFGNRKEEKSYHIGCDQLTLDSLSKIPLKKKLYFKEYPYWKVNFLLRPPCWILDVIFNLNKKGFEKHSRGIVIAS